MKYLIQNNLINLGDNLVEKFQDENLFIENLNNNIESINQPNHKQILKKILENYLDFKKFIKF